MPPELDSRVEALTKQVKDLAEELRDKSDIPVDRVQAIEDEITAKSAQIDDLIAEKRQNAVDAQLAAMDERLKALQRSTVQTKASAILAGAGAPDSTKTVGQYSDTNFLSALINRKNGDPQAAEFVKAVLGTTTATGLAVVPNNFVAGLVTQIAANNIYRDLFNVVTGVTGPGVDIPYEVTAITAALLQGAYGSNKDVRDFGLSLYTSPSPRDA
jgi:HK97 family phage major capsid protein